MIPKLYTSKIFDSDKNKTLIFQQQASKAVCRVDKMQITNKISKRWWIWWKWNKLKTQLNWGIATYFNFLKSPQNRALSWYAYFINYERSLIFQSTSLKIYNTFRAALHLTNHTTPPPHETEAFDKLRKPFRYHIQTENIEPECVSL